jgi:hypothetical protein
VNNDLEQMGNKSVLARFKKYRFILPAQTEENYEHLRILCVPAEFRNEPLKGKIIPVTGRRGP